MTNPFGRFQVGDQDDCCGGDVCDCDNCTDPTDPGELQVDIAGVVPYATSKCDTEANPCDTFNDSFVDDWCGCFFSYDSGTSGDCFVGLITGQLYQDGDDYILRFELAHHLYPGSPTLVDDAAFEVNLGTDKPDCHLWDELDVPLVENSGWCDFSAATLKVTAIAPA